MINNRVSHTIISHKVTLWINFTSELILFTSELISFHVWLGFPGGTGKESACNAGDRSLIPGSGRFPGGGHGNPLQYSCLENPMDRFSHDKEQTTVHGVAQRKTRLKRLSSSSSSVLGCIIKGKDSRCLCKKDIYFSIIEHAKQCSNNTVALKC